MTKLIISRIKQIKNNGIKNNVPIILQNCKDFIGTYINILYNKVISLTKIIPILIGKNFPIFVYSSDLHSLKSLL